MPKQPQEQPQKQPQKLPPAGAKRSRLVNQVLLDRMVELRRQGFSLEQIAAKVQRSERTVRRYVQGVTPQLQLPTAPKRVDVVLALAKVIVYYRTKWGLSGKEVDYFHKKLRKELGKKDPMTLEWMSTDPAARQEFLLKEFLPRAFSEIKTIRMIDEKIAMFGSTWVEDENDDPT